MFKLAFKDSFTFKLSICSILVLCNVLPIHALDRKHIVNETKYNAPSSWNLAHVGKGAKHFLALFFAYANDSAVKTVIRIGVHKDKMVESLIGFTLMQQIPMSIAIVLGSLIVLLLLLMPYFIKMYRSRQTSDLEVPGVNGSLIKIRFGWLVYEVLSVFLAVTVFGGVVMCLSAIEFHNKLPEIFKVAAYAVNSSFNFKTNTVHQFSHNLIDISNSASDTIKLIHDINVEIKDRFMTKISYRLNPVRIMSQSIQWDILSFEKSLKHIRQSFDTLQNAIDRIIAERLSIYDHLLQDVKTNFERENQGQVISSTINISSLALSPYNPNNVSFDRFENASKRLENARKVDFQPRLENLTRFIEDSVENSTFDPREIIRMLTNISFKTKMTVGDTVTAYVNYINKAFSEEERDATQRKIESYGNTVSRYFHYFFVFVLICSISSAVVAVFFFLFFTLGISGTKGFRIQYNSAFGYKSHLSHVSGKIIVVMIYITVLFLAFFWAVSIVLFMLSAIPFELCLSINDESILNMTFDSDSYRSTQGWHSIYSSKQFNISLRNTLSECEQDRSYFRPLPDEIVSKSDFDDIKNNVSTKTVQEAFEKALVSLQNSTINETELSILDLSNMLNFNLHSYFANIRDYTEMVAEKRILPDLSTIILHPKSSNILKSLAYSMITVYNELLSFMSKSAANEDTYSLAVQNASYEMLLAQIDSFKMAIQEFDDFLEGNLSELYMSTVNETVAEMIDDVEKTLRISLFNFRKSISLCDLFIYLKEQLIFVVCELVMLPLAASWFGSFLVDVFLLLSVFLCLYAVPLFLKSPTSEAAMPPAVIHHQDIPTTYSLKVPSGAFKSIQTIKNDSSVE